MVEQTVNPNQMIEGNLYKILNSISNFEVFLLLHKKRLGKIEQYFSGYSLYSDVWICTCLINNQIEPRSFMFDQERQKYSGPEIVNVVDTRRL